MLIERDAADLDLATNLSDDMHEVFGFTQFERGRKPLVKIARELWEQRHRNNRLRTTLTHEYGHVMLHTWLYDKYGAARGAHRCYWQSLLPTERVFDWFEWQAGYASGALLMPESFARRTAEAYFQNRYEHPPVAKGSPEASSLCQRISLAFDVKAWATSFLFVENLTLRSQGSAQTQRSLAMLSRMRLSTVFRLPLQLRSRASKPAGAHFFFQRRLTLKQKSRSKKRNQKLWAVSGHSGEHEIARIPVST